MFEIPRKKVVSRPRGECNFKNHFANVRIDLLDGKIGGTFYEITERGYEAKPQTGQNFSINAYFKRISLAPAKLDSAAAKFEMDKKIMG